MDSPACAGCAHLLPVLAACLRLFALSHLSSRADCVSSGLRPRSCIRLAADITLRLAPSCYILQSSWPVNLKLSLKITLVSCSQHFSFGLAPSAALSGRVCEAPRTCALGSSSPRTGDQLQLSSRAAHPLARNATLGLRRRPHACGSADDSISSLRQLLHPSAKLATSFRGSIGCRIFGFRRLPASPLLPFPESFSRVLVGLPACAGPQLPHSAFVRPRISSVAGSLGLRFEPCSLRHPIPLTGLW